jgi:hypothetical protein
MMSIGNTRQLHVSKNGKTYEEHNHLGGIYLRDITAMNLIYEL